MAIFLKIVSGIYLLFVWLVFAITIARPTPLDVSVGKDAANVLTFLIAIVLSIPAVALFAFGQIVGDIRVIRNNARAQSDHLRAMRAYYEPQAR
jgi:ABC-type proline/glycine betaine transport system permease subunit